MTTYDYGAVDPLAVAPRYTSLATIKRRMGIPITNIDKDDDITAAIIAAEYSLDVTLGRSFPDGPGDGEDIEPGPVQGIPEAAIIAATSISLAVYKEGDAPTGTAGSDSWFGALDIGEETRRVVDRSVVLRGFMVSEGFGVA